MGAEEGSEGSQSITSVANNVTQNQSVSDVTIFRYYRAGILRTDGKATRPPLGFAGY
jgi:hypothetical protein